MNKKINTKVVISSIPHKKGNKKVRINIQMIVLVLIDFAKL